MLSQLASAYSAAAATAPLRTAALIGFATATFGDALAQRIEDPAAPYALRRGLEMGLTRGLVISPLLTFYFVRLAQAVPGRAWGSVLRRLALDQAVGAPLNAALTFTVVELLRGQPSAVAPRIATELLPTWQASMSYWPFVHLINFRYVSPASNALVANVAAIPWAVFLAFRANSKLAGAQESVGSPVRGFDSGGESIALEGESQPA